MPDGDRVHPRLARAYQKVYKQLCEGRSSSESLANEAVRTIKCQLQQGGDAPAHLVAQIASRLTELPKEPLLRGMIDWSAKSREIDQIVAQAGVPKRIGEHIAEASKGLLYDIRIGETVSKTNVQLLERALNRLYLAEFEERVPMVQHHQDASQQFVQACLDEMRPFVKQKLAYLARQAAKYTSFERLRQPPMAKPTINIDDTQLSRLAFHQLPFLYADMIDLAVAVHIADRFARGGGDLPRQLHLQIPMRHRELFERQAILDKLRDILFWYTNDKWEFTFTSRQTSGRISEIQRCMNLDEGYKHTTIVL